MGDIGGVRGLACAGDRDRQQRHVALNRAAAWRHSALMVCVARRGVATAARQRRHRRASRNGRLRKPRFQRLCCTSSGGTCAPAHRSAGIGKHHRVIGEQTQASIGLLAKKKWYRFCASRTAHAHLMLPLLYVDLRCATADGLHLFFHMDRRGARVAYKWRISIGVFAGFAWTYSRHQKREQGASGEEKR